MNRNFWLIVGAGALLVFALFYTVYSFEDSEPWGERVAVVRVVGMISVDGYGARTNPQDIGDLIDKAEENPSVKAIVLEIDSPGGTPVGSDEIARHVEDAEKPIVVWIADVGASGGYWIAASGDYVMAHPMSLTGSIGAYSMVITIPGLLEEWDIGSETIKSGKYKDIGTPFREMTGEEREILQDMVDDIHTEFVSHIAEQRGMSVEEVEAIADGRPFSGREALELGLVDGLGNREDAIDKAAELGGISGEPEILVLEVSEPFFNSFFSKAAENIGYGIGAGLRDNLIRLQ